MKFLADMGVPRAPSSRSEPQVTMSSTRRTSGSTSCLDADILVEARTQGRIVVTFDLDFGDLLAAGGEALPSVMRAGLHLGRTTVRRMLQPPPKRPRPVPSQKEGRTITARRPNHVWHVDLTTVPTSTPSARDVTRFLGFHDDRKHLPVVTLRHAA